MDPLPLLKDLVAIPSVNPMGRDISGPDYYETRVTQYLVDFFRTLGVPFEVIEIVPGRANVLARLDADSPAPTVLLDAHQDTVPVDGMTIAPFDPVERDGRVWGRGSCDVKGGLAAMLSAFSRLVKERPSGRANVVLSCTCDEEATSLGINALVGSWTGRAPVSPLCPQRPDMAIIAEPTLLEIVVAHRGATRWKLQTAGRACHSSRPSDGINAIYRMAKVLSVLEEYATWVPGSRPAHPLCGPATLSVGLISGGSSVNVVPDHCVIEIDRRVIPGEENLAVQREVIDYLADRIDFDVAHGEPYCTSPPLGDDCNGDLANRLSATIRQCGTSPRILGVPFGTHASRLGRLKIPAVVFGPGDIAQAHTRDEWIDIDSLRQASEIYYQFCAATHNVV